MLSDFPSTHGKTREDLILDIVEKQQDRLSYDWYSLKIEHKGHNAQFFVMSDALKIDGIRINVTAHTQQVIADKWGCTLLTAKLSDLIWHNADIRLKPCPRKITSSTKGMINHSQDIDKQLEDIDCSGKLLSTVGKNWIITNKLISKPGIACNHGWHFSGNSFQGINGNVNPSLLKNPETKTYWKLIQSMGTAHDSINHSDYSQICRLVCRECIINGKTMDLIDVFKDKTLSTLVNHDGVLNYTRVSTVPESSVVFVTPKL
jgi:hypothetical protein